MTILHDIPLSVSPGALDKEEIVEGIELPLAEGIAEVHFNLDDPQFSRDILALREDFVINAMHWFGADHKEGDDPYDLDPTTMHIGLREFADGRMTTALRLSEPHSLNTTLSLTMLNEAALKSVSEQTLEGVNAIDHLANLIASGNLRDMTRLVAAPEKSKQDPQHIVNSMMELFGVTASIVRDQMEKRHPDKPNEVKNIKWLFATTETIWYVLQAQGVQMTTIINGDFSDDNEINSDRDQKIKREKSYLCLVDQEAAIKYMQDRPEEFAHSLPYLENGLDGLIKANAL